MVGWCYEAAGADGARMMVPGGSHCRHARGTAPLSCYAALCGVRYLPGVCGYQAPTFVHYFTKHIEKLEVRDQMPTAACVRYWLYCEGL